MLQNSKSKVTSVNCLSQLRDEIHRAVEKLSMPTYEPTGLQEDVILAFGKGLYQIIVALHPNDVGKTAVGANIAKNIIWPHDPTWFSWWDGYSVFRDRTWTTKEFRIASEHTNLAETGAIQKEIGIWWPLGRYEWLKGGKPFPSQCTTDSGWKGDALSYTQDRKQFESKKIDFAWFDEPADQELIGATTSRFSEADKMLLLITATPIKCGPFLDVINDLKDKGTRVKYLTGTAWENSIEEGKPNHLGTKRGLRTKEAIEAKIASTPIDERDARIYGKANAKSGRIYADFDRNIHVRDFDLSSEYAKSWNCFCTMDPHRKAYPFIQWWGFAPDEKLICYNEWPTFEFLQNNYYDEIRDTLVCTYDPEKIAQFIKIFDGTQFGLKIFKRWMDRRFGKESEGIYGKSTESLLVDYAKFDVIFELPPAETIDIQRESIRRLLKYDKQLPIIQGINEPKIFYMPHCHNSIRAIERHYWDENSEKEAERYKDPNDCTRILLAGMGNWQYKKPETVKEKNKPQAPSVNPLVERMKNQLAEICLS